MRGVECQSCKCPSFCLGVKDLQISSNSNPTVGLFILVHFGVRESPLYGQSPTSPAEVPTPETQDQDRHDHRTLPFGPSRGGSPRCDTLNGTPGGPSCTASTRPYRFMLPFCLSPYTTLALPTTYSTHTRLLVSGVTLGCHFPLSVPVHTYFLSVTLYHFGTVSHLLHSYSFPGKRCYIVMSFLLSVRACYSFVEQKSHTGTQMSRAQMSRASKPFGRSSTLPTPTRVLDLVCRPIPSLES